jgi:hypothetical protein
LKSVNGTLILVFGILGFVFCPIFGLIAWSMGTNAIRAIDNEDGYDDRERGLVNVGRLCGIISSILWLGFLLLRLITLNAGH